MRYVIILIFVFLLSSLHAQIRKEYWDNGNLKFSLNTEKNILKDTCTWYYSNGNPKLQIYFFQGRPWDLIFMKDTAGNAINGGTLKGGIGSLYTYGGPLEGLVYNIAEHLGVGKITRITQYVNGLEDGQILEFYDYPLDTASVFTYKEGRLNGYFRQYNKKTGVITVCNCVNGKKENCRFLTRDGKKVHNPTLRRDTVTNLSYEGNKLCEGKYTIICLPDDPGYARMSSMYNDYIEPHLNDEPGQADLEIYFTKGRIDSMFRYEYSYFGIISMLKMNWIDSTRTYIKYFNVNKVMSVKTSKFQASIVDGRVRWKYSGPGRLISYFRNGKTEKIANFLDDNLDGELLEFSKEGTLVKTRKYKDNKLIE